MASAKLRIGFVAIVVLTVIHTGAALKCYQCSETTHPDCKDPFNRKAPTQDCSNTQVCVKHVTKPIGDVPSIVHRGCEEKNYCDGVLELSKQCGVCSEDLCNSSSNTAPFVLLIALLYIMKKYLV